MVTLPSTLQPSTATLIDTSALPLSQMANHNLITSTNSRGLSTDL